MQRYFITNGLFGGKNVTISGDDAHHILRVMRAKPGEKVIVCDGSGNEAVAEIVSSAKSVVEASVLELRRSAGEPRVEVWIAQGLPKGDKMETVIQKGTEIGASRFIPFISERTVVQYDAKKEAQRLERWGRIAKEAAELAHRGRIPDVAGILPWHGLMAVVSKADAAFICYEKEEALQFRGLLQDLRRLQPDGNAQPVKLLLIVGPEGGFTEEEIRAAESAGCKCVSLGKRILRTETAAMVGLSCILYEYGEIGG